MDSVLCRFFTNLGSIYADFMAFSVRLLVVITADGKGVWGACTCLRKYNHVLHTWEDPTFFPLEWREYGRTSEASVIRAANGNLVASFRSGRPGPSSLPADKWRGIVTATSADNGATWSWPQVHSLYAHVHSSLLLLPDGRILLTCESPSWLPSYISARARSRRAA